MNAYASWFERHRRLVAIAVIVVTAVALAGAAQVEIDVNIRNLFRSDDRAMEVLERLYGEFGTDDYDCLVLLEGEDLFDPAAIAVLRALADAARGLDEVETVVSLADAIVFEPGRSPRPLLPAPGADRSALAQARADALAHPLVAGRLLSEDGRAAIVLVRLSTEIDYLEFLRAADNPLNALVNAVVADMKITATLTGIPVVRTEMLTAIQREQIIFVGVGSVAGGVIALLLFRRLAAVVIVTVSSVTGSLWTVGLLGLVGEPLNPVNSVIPTLVLVVGFTDAVHMLHAARRAIDGGAEPADAAVRTIRLVGPACALTSMTTAIGFASLAAARLDVIERFGVAAAAGAVLSFLAVITIAPLLIATPLGRRACSRRPSSGDSSRHADRLISALLARPRVAAVLGVTATVGLAVICTNLYASTWLREGLPARSESTRAIAVIDEAFGGVLSLIVLVEWDHALDRDPEAVLSAIGEVERRLEAEEWIGAPQSILDVLDLLPESVGARSDKLALLRAVPGDLVRRVYRPDLRRAVVLANVPDAGTHAQLPLLAALADDLAQIEAKSPGISIELSGNPIAIGRSASFMIEDLAKSLALAAGVIFLVMTVAFRSIVIGLLCVVPNVFPLVAAGSFLVLIDHPLTITGVITFCVCLGIAVDDTIHLVARTRRAIEEGHEVREAVEIALRRVGAALLTTTAVLIGGFGALLLSSMPMLVLFGTLCCVALLAALVGDLVVLPVLLVSFWRGRSGDRPGTGQDATNRS